MMSDREQLITQLTHYRNRTFAELVVLIIGLAAETHPDELRRAIGKVFDLEAVEDTARRATLIASQARQAAHEAATDVRILVDEIHKQLDGIEARLDRMDTANPVQSNPRRTA